MTGWQDGTIWVEGLRFGEGPRWRDNSLYFSDMHDGKVWRIAVPGAPLELVAEVPAHPSGLGWLPDGQLLIVSMQDKKLLRQEADGSLSIHADLSDLADHICNDMLVDPKGNAYVGNFGFDLYDHPIKPKPTCLILATPDGKVRKVDDDVFFPNGTVMTADGKTLIVGESFGQKLTAFTVQDDGSLTEKRVWADLPGMTPDGICMDSEGAIWITSPGSRTVNRIAEGGDVLDTIEIECDGDGMTPFACMLGGEDGRDLMILIATESDPGKTTARTGKLISFRVAVGRGNALP